MKKIISSFFIILLFMFFFSPILNIIVPIHLGLLSCALVFFLFLRKIVFKTHKISFKLFFLSLFLFNLAFTSLFLNLMFGKYLDTIYFKSFISLSIYITFGMFFSLMLNNNFKNVDDFLKFFFTISKMIIIINSIIIIIEIFNPNVRILIENLFIKSNEENIDYLSRIDRYRGLSMGGGAGLSLFMSWGAALVTYDYFTSKGLYKLLLTLINLIIIFVSMFFVGRTGFLVYVLYLIISLVYNFKFSIIKKSFVILPFIIYLPVLLLDYSLIEDFILKRVMSIIVFFDSEGDKTMFELAKSINLDDDFISIILGAGNSSGSYSINSYSDIGYMKMLTSMGLILSSVFYFVSFYVFWMMSKKSKRYKKLLHALVILFFISEIKEPFIVKGPTSRFMWFLLGALIKF